MDLEPARRDCLSLSATTAGSPSSRPRRLPRRHPHSDAREPPPDPRYDDIEIHANAHVEVADNLATAMERMGKRLGIPPEVTLQAPGILAGSVNAIVDQIWAWCERFDVSYLTFDESVLDRVAPIVAKAAGN